MKFMRSKSGQSMVEWLLGAAILVAVVGGVLLALFGTLRDRLQAVNDAL